MNSGEQVVLRDYPILFWLLGGLCLFIAGKLIDELGGRIVFGLMGLAAITLSSMLTVTVDRSRGLLNLHYRSLLRAWTKSYEITDVSGVWVKEDYGEGTYRIEFTLWSGGVVPLRTIYSAGRRGKERQAARLRAALGILSLV